MRDATTFDIMVTDVYSTWEKAKANPEDSENYSVDQLQEIMNSVRG